MSDFISILIYSIWQQGATQEWFESDETNRNEISQRIPNERTPLRNNHHTCTKSQRFSRVSRRGEASNINININIKKKHSSCAEHLFPRKCVRYQSIDFRIRARFVSDRSESSTPRFRIVKRKREKKNEDVLPVS